MNEGYRGLIVWQKSMELVVMVYKVAKFLPKEETYALSDQMRRAVVSVPSNIAEGYMRFTPREYAKFLSIARGSCGEVMTQIMICEKLGYVDSTTVKNILELSDEVCRILYAMREKILASAS
ncbi:MAG: four helix bundle protein [Acidaminococcaceae bacterium]|nr:four helix bundle protein [Acidaminococcaceae bacterium]